MAAFVLIVSAACLFLSYDIARVSRGPPRAWYLFMLAFAVLFVYRALELYVDTLSPAGVINDTEALVSLLANVLLLGGLWMLDLSFRRNLKQLLVPE